MATPEAQDRPRKGTSRLWLAVGLVVLLAAIAVALVAGGSGSGARTKSAAAGPCGYSASGIGAIPAEAAEVLPGHPVLTSSEALAGGGYRDVTLTEVRFKPAIAAVKRNALAHGWKLSGGETEAADAEMLLRRGSESMQVALKKVAGCTGTQAEVTHIVQG